MKIYILEILNRLLLSSFTSANVTLVCYIYKEILLFIILKQSASCDYQPFYYIFTDVQEIFYSFVVIIFFIVNQIWLFYLAYHILIFILPGLFYYEYSFVVSIYKTSLILFFFATFIFNNIFFTICWDFFHSFQQLKSNSFAILAFEPKINEYLFFYTKLYYHCVIYFQLLIVLFLFIERSKKETDAIKNLRKVFYYFFVFFSTLVTPPDIFSQLLLSLCLIISYEILIFYSILKSALFNLKFLVW